MIIIEKDIKLIKTLFNIFVNLKILIYNRSNLKNNR